MGRAIATIACFLSIFVGFGAKPGHSADLIWQVENPFRFFKSTRSFAYQEAAFNAVRGTGPLPADIIWRTERRAQRSRLQGLVLARSLRRDRGQALSAEPPRLGGADAQRHCYEVNGKPRRYSATLRPQIFVGQREGRLHPARRAHRDDTDRARAACRRAPAIASGAGSRARRRQDRDESSSPASKPLTISRVPYSQQAAQVGRVGHGEAAGRPRACRPRRRGRGSFHRGARRFLRVGRKQSGSSGPVQSLARDGL